MFKKTREQSGVRGLVLAGVILLGGAVASVNAATLATFADPTVGSGGIPTMFTIDFSAAQLTGGWADGLGGLTLHVRNNTYVDAWFDITPVTITNNTDWLLGRQTEAGTINFYEAGGVAPILTITFGQAWVTLHGYGATELNADNVIMTGPSLGSLVLSDEAFAFSFANQTPLDGKTYREGFTATAAFTSSAVPEPATLAILGVGTLFALRRRRAA